MNITEATIKALTEEDGNKLKPFARPVEDVVVFKQEYIETENGDSIALKNVRLDKEYTYFPDYPELIADVDTTKSTIKKGDSFGLRMLRSHNVNVYGMVEKVTPTSIIVVHPRGTEYVIGLNNCKLAISSGEIRMFPKDADKSGWFGFMYLDDSSADDFKTKAKHILNKILEED